MKQYKVIKEFGCAQKGDVLHENEEGLFELNMECDCNDCYCSRSICISADIASTLALAGYLEEAVEMTTTSIAKDKLQKVSDRIEELLVQYAADHQELQEQYNEGEVPACVMTEANTVYFNMEKVLKHIQDLINE